MTSGGFDHGARPRSANLFSCQQNSLNRRYFAKVTVEDEFVFVPAATVTVDDETVAAPVFPLERLTTLPPVGAFALSVTVPVDVTPPMTLAGLSETDERFCATAGRARRAVAVAIRRRPDTKGVDLNTRSSFGRRTSTADVHQGPQTRFTQMLVPLRTRRHARWRRIGRSRPIRARSRIGESSPRQLAGAPAPHVRREVRTRCCPAFGRLPYLACRTANPTVFGSDLVTLNQFCEALLQKPAPRAALFGVLALAGRAV